MKALGRAKELGPDDWLCSYLIGEVKYQTGQYQEAIDSFKSILAHRPSEVGVLMSLGQAYLDFGLAEISTGFFARAEQTLTACISTALQAIHASPGFRLLAWKIVADAVLRLSDCPAFKEESMCAELSEVSSLLPEELSGRLSGIVSSHDLRSACSFDELKVLAVAIAAYDYRVSLGSSESLSSSSAWYDLGIALHSWSRKTPSPEGRLKSHEQAISCFKEALLRDPENDLIWNAFGNIHFDAQPKIAQHAYIKAIEIDSKVRSGFSVKMSP
jgi:superkiller protein 3